MGEEETVTALGEVGAISLTQGPVESSCGDWDFKTGGMGDSLIEGGDVDSSVIPNWMGMSEFVLIEGGRSETMLHSVIGTGEEAGDGGRLSCVDGMWSTTVA